MSLFSKSYDDFLASVVPIQERLETRRKRFLQSLKTTVIGALLLLAAVFLWNWKFALVASPFLIYFAVYPIYSYRVAKISLAGNLWWKFERLDEVAFNQLLAFFGNFLFREKAYIPIQDLKKSGILPEFDVYECEDVITGEYADVKVQIGEGRLIRSTHAAPESVFRGLLILIDICNTNIKLRAPFSGKTVVISDSGKFNTFFVELYKSYSNFPLPSENLEREFEAYCTVPNEAKQLLTIEFLGAIKNLHTLVNQVQLQHQHFDAKATEILQDQASKSRYISHTKAINESVQCAFYDDKMLVSVPYPHDLFEPDSIFDKPLNDEDMKLLYMIMTTTFTLVEHVLKTKQ